jgi:hypothetical protein
MQNSLVRRELLQSTDPAARANDGDQVVGLHLLIDKTSKGLACLVNTTERHQ